eukprot:1149214-Pelagomonas_calceolata.AAC.4
MSATAGTTLNSALGIGVPSTHKDFGAMHKQETRVKIQAYQVRGTFCLPVLVIDEASMLSAEMFEKVEEKLGKVAHDGEAAGCNVLHRSLARKGGGLILYASWLSVPVRSVIAALLDGSAFLLFKGVFLGTAPPQYFTPFPLPGKPANQGTMHQIEAYASVCNGCALPL